MVNHYCVVFIEKLNGNSASSALCNYSRGSRTSNDLIIIIIANLENIAMTEAHLRSTSRLYIEQ